MLLVLRLTLITKHAASCHTLIFYSDCILLLLLLLSLSLSLCVPFLNANTTSLSPLVTVVNKHFLLILSDSLRARSTLPTTCTQLNNIMNFYKLTTSISPYNLYYFPFPFTSHLFYYASSKIEYLTRSIVSHSDLLFRLYTTTITTLSLSLSLSLSLCVSFLMCS
jgi:hypothetical protein